MFELDETGPWIHVPIHLTLSDSVVARYPLATPTQVLLRVLTKRTLSVNVVVVVVFFHLFSCFGCSVDVPIVSLLPIAVSRESNTQVYHST